MFLAQDDILEVYVAAVRQHGVILGLLTVKLLSQRLKLN